MIKNKEQFILDQAWRALTVQQQSSLSILSCPNTNVRHTLRILYTNCATTPTPTGRTVTHINGSIGPEYSSYSCTSLTSSHCVWWYSACCPNGPTGGSCPPGIPIFTFGYSIVGIPTEFCGEITVPHPLADPFGNGPQTITLPCHSDPCPSGD